MGDDLRLFVHARGIITEGRTALAAGERVEFGVEIGDKGPRCARLVVIEPAAT